MEKNMKIKLKLKNKYQSCFIIILIIILIPLVVNARYFEKLQNIRGKAFIAEPIFKVENLQETITETINKETQIKDYIFKIKNYELLQDGKNKRISEVDMEYNIQIVESDSKFPIMYELYELEDNKNLLDNTNKTVNYKISKNIEYEKTYKLVVCWKNKQENLSNEDVVKIVVNSSQTK